MGLIKISVILPTHSRPDQLKDCLRSLLKQEYPTSHFEVIVVDDSGTHYARHLLREFGELSLRYIPHDRNKGVAAARNTGIRNARYPHVALLEDDLVLPPEYLLTIHNYFRLPRASVLRFRFTPLHQSAWSMINQSYISDVPQTKDRYESSNAPILTEFALRLQRAGIPIHVHNTLMVAHAHRARFLDSLRQKYSWGRNVAALKRIYPEYTHPLPPAHKYYITRLFTATLDQALHENRLVKTLIHMPFLFLLNAAWTVGVFRGEQ